MSVSSVTTIFTNMSEMLSLSTDSKVIVTTVDGGAVPAWQWALIGIAAALCVAVVIAAALVLRRRRQQQNGSPMQSIDQQADMASARCECALFVC